MVCDWWIWIRFVSFCVSRFVATAAKNAIVKAAFEL